MFRALWLCLLLLAAAAALASPPHTLGYQGRLADAGGIPISGTLGITFRLYDVPEGGAALWSETRTVEVDGGNLSVELGTTVPLPDSAWGRQLYLGVQVAGDSEMLPRPALTAAPFALRAAGTMKRTLAVSAEGTPGENGTALLAAVAGIVDATAASPVAVELDAGSYDLGAAQLQPPQYVTLIGRSPAATLITSAHTNATLFLRSHSGVRQLTVRNTGVPPTPTDSAVGLLAADTSVFQGLVDDIALEGVVAESLAASGSQGQRAGALLCASNVRVQALTARAEGGQFAMGLRADCPTSSGLRIDGATLIASGGSEGVRGGYFAGGGAWSDIRVFVEANATAMTVYGVRVLANTVDARAAFFDLLVEISGNDLVSATATTLIEGVRVENTADVAFHRAKIRLERVKAAFISGARLFGDDTSSQVVVFTDSEIAVRGVQDAALEPGEIVGVRAQGAAPELRRIGVRVECLPGGYNTCSGIHRTVAPGPPNTVTTSPQAGALLLDQGSVLVGHVDPADASAASFAYSGPGPARIVNSSLRVLRSADNEFHYVVRLDAASADVRVLDSTLEVENPGDPDAGCVIGGASGSAELFGNHWQGNACGGGAAVTCSGNTKRGAGFLATTCQ